MDSRVTGRWVLAALLAWCVSFAGLSGAGFAASSAWVMGFAPQRYENSANYGMGVYYAPYTLEIYATPDATTEPVEVLTWRHGNNSLGLMSKAQNAPIQANNVFLAYYPSMDAALLTVVGDNDEGWAEVVYDHARKKTGWVRLRESLAAEATADWPGHFGVFQTWLEFMRLNGQANGIYWLTGVSEYHRSLRTSPEDTAKLVKTIMIRSLKVRHVRGNWLLVEVQDFDRTSPIGWVRWRDEEGRLMVFPNFTGERLPAILGKF